MINQPRPKLQREWAARAARWPPVTHHQASTPPPYARFTPPPGPRRALVGEPLLAPQATAQRQGPDRRGAHIKVIAPFFSPCPPRWSVSTARPKPTWLAPAQYRPDELACYARRGRDWLTPQRGDLAPTLNAPANAASPLSNQSNMTHVTAGLPGPQSVHLEVSMPNTPRIQPPRPRSSTSPRCVAIDAHTRSRSPATVRRAAGLGAR